MHDWGILISYWHPVVPLPIWGLNIVPNSTLLVPPPLYFDFRCGQYSLSLSEPCFFIRSFNNNKIQCFLYFLCLLHSFLSALFYYFSCLVSGAIVFTWRICEIKRSYHILRLHFSNCTTSTYFQSSSSWFNQHLAPEFEDNLWHRFFKKGSFIFSLVVLKTRFHL